jgi:hypothetical protein
VTPVPRVAVVEPGLYGVYQDNDVGAMNQAVWAFADARRTHDDPIDAARAVIAVEYLADELRGSPRWIGMSGTVKAEMVKARTDVRWSLGIKPDAPPQLVINALTRLIAALNANDESAASRALDTPVFTLPPAQMLTVLTNLPYMWSANIATMQASNEELSYGGH